MKSVFTTDGWKIRAKKITEIQMKTTFFRIFSYSLCSSIGQYSIGSENGLEC